MLRAELLPPADAANVRNLLTASPDAPPHGLLPNMSESSGTRARTRSGFSLLSVSLAEPCPGLTLVMTIVRVGEWVSNKKPSSVVFPPLASSRVKILEYLCVRPIHACSRYKSF